MKGRENPQNERDNQEIRVREREGRFGKWESERGATLFMGLL